MKNEKTYNSLRDFIAALDSEGELLRIKASVSPILEISEITTGHPKHLGAARRFFSRRWKALRCPSSPMPSAA